MNPYGYLVYGARLSSSYCGCDAYGYRYNEICAKYLDESDGISPGCGTYLPHISAMECLDACVEQNIPANLLFCRVITDVEADMSAECAPYGDNMEFLGFDIAWNAYDYYSSILHEVIAEHGALHNQQGQLNPHGLFSEYAQAKAYLELRKEAKSIAGKGQFEEGDFDIVAIWG